MFRYCCVSFVLPFVIYLARSLGVSLFMHVASCINLGMSPVTVCLLYLWIPLFSSLCRFKFLFPRGSFVLYVFLSLSMASVMSLVLQVVSSCYVPLCRSVFLHVWWYFLASFFLYVYVMCFVCVC